jgi:pimeloyl-ACP methyl ester carboxylesterase
MSQTLNRYYAIFLLMVVNVAAAANPTKTESPDLTLTSCHLKGIKQQVQCGSLKVSENYQQTTGAKISINFAVLPAIDGSLKKAPFMFLAGGPGQAAVELAPSITKLFYDVRKTHDIILIDQRGTGKSHPLQCDEQSQQDIYRLAAETVSEQEIKQCLAKFTGDLTQYNSENAIRDFEAVRAALGHQQVHLYGGSYGTRAALVYLRMFPQALRSVVLDSVGPIEVPIGLFGQSAAQAFDKLVQHCQQQTECQQAFPSLAEEFNQLVKRLEQQAVTTNIQHPRLGGSTDFVVTKEKLLNVLRMQLYNVSMRNLVPLVIHQAFLENYLPLAGLLAQTDGDIGMYIGLTFNIVCNEDLPKLSPAMFSLDANNSFDGNLSHKAWLTACPLWPQYRPSAEFYQPVTAKVPTLILSGGLDPVTPPSNGEFAANSLPNSHHIVVDNAAHIVASHSCAPELINEFLDSLTPDKLDESCLQEVAEESFMTNVNGTW